MLILPLRQQIRKIKIRPTLSMLNTPLIKQLQLTNHSLETIIEKKI
jgi:hypothetical protein